METAILLKFIQEGMQYQMYPIYILCIFELYIYCPAVSAKSIVGDEIVSCRNQIMSFAFCFMNGMYHINYQFAFCHLCACKIVNLIISSA